jgi:hypothetical protein
MKKHILKTWIVCLLILSLTACNLPEGVDPNTPDFNLTVTANAAAIETALASGQLPPEAQGLPATEDPAIPPTEEIVIPAEVLPPAAGDVTVTVSVATNCRQGPSAAFASVYGMPVGQVAKVVAKNSYSGYWIIEIPGKNGQTCWLWGQYATVTGDTASLKDVVTPTSVATLKPTATKTPTATATNTVSAGAPAIAGCTDPTASNYNSAATVSDGSCTYTGPAFIGGCMDPNATNYNPNANADDGSCNYPAVTKPNAPTIKDYACTVTGPDSDGNYTYDYDFVWNDNSNNEDFFTVYVPEGGILGSSIKYPANSTQHFGSFVLPSATSEFITVRVTVHNAAGVAGSPTVNLICE